MRLISLTLRKCIAICKGYVLTFFKYICFCFSQVEYNETKEPLQPYNTETKPYIRMFDTDSGDVAIEMAYNYKPRKMAFWNRLMVDRENFQDECEISRSIVVLSNCGVIVTMLLIILLDLT